MNTHKHTCTHSYLKLTRLILAGGSSVRSRSKAPLSTLLISCKRKKQQHTNSLSVNMMIIAAVTNSQRVHQQTHTEQNSGHCEREEACRQLAEQSNAAINHLCRRRRESDRRTPSPYHAPPSFLHSMYISSRLPLPPPPSIPAPCQARLYF